MSTVEPTNLTFAVSSESAFNVKLSGTSSPASGILIVISSSLFVNETSIVLLSSEILRKENVSIDFALNTPKPEPKLFMSTFTSNALISIVAISLGTCTVVTVASSSVIVKLKRTFSTTVTEVTSPAICFSLTCYVCFNVYKSF